MVYAPPWPLYPMVTLLRHDVVLSLQAAHKPNLYACTTGDFSGWPLTAAVAQH